MPFEHVLLYPTLTLSIFLLSGYLYNKSGNIAVLQPVLIAIVTLTVILLLFDIPYKEFKQDMGLFQILLTPAIIALAIPLYNNLQKAKEYFPVLLTTICIGGSIIILTAVGLAFFAGLEAPYLLPMTTKSVSAPIALSIANETNAVVSLTILAVFSTGLPGAAFTPTLLKIMRVEDEEIQGLVLGMTSHAFGIARAIEYSPRATAFATLGMGLMGCFVALTVPMFVKIVGI